MVRLIDEPTAAAVAQFMKNRKEYDKMVIDDGDQDEGEKYLEITNLIADFGGGTCDFSKLRFQGKMNIETKEIRWSFICCNITGIPQFGGQDISNNIKNYFFKSIKSKITDAEWGKIDEEDKVILHNDLLQIATKCKYRLTSKLHSEHKHRFNGNNYTLELSRAMLQKLNERHIVDIKDQINKCIQGEEIDQVIMVGGTANVPFVQKTVKTVVGEKCKIVNINQKRDMVGMGAAYIGAIMDDPNTAIEFQRINAFNVGIGLYGNEMLFLIKKGDPIPYKRTDPQKLTNPKAGTQCVLNVYEGVEERADKNTLIGTEVIKFDKYYKAEKFVMMVGAKLDNNGIFTITVKSAKTNSDIVSWRTSFGHQADHIVESDDKKEIDEEEKEMQRQQLISEYKNKFDALMNELEDDVNNKDIAKWKRAKLASETIEDWKGLIESMEKRKRQLDKNVSSTKKENDNNKNIPIIQSDDDEEDLIIVESKNDTTITKPSEKHSGIFMSSQKNMSF